MIFLADSQAKKVDSIQQGICLGNISTARRQPSEQIFQVQISTMQCIVAKALEQPIVMARDRDFPSLLARNSYDVVATDYLHEHLIATISIPTYGRPRDLIKISDRQFRNLPQYLAKKGLSHVFCTDPTRLNQLIANYHWQRATVHDLSLMTSIRADLLDIDFSTGSPWIVSHLNLTGCQAKVLALSSWIGKMIITTRPQKLIVHWRSRDPVHGPFDLTIQTNSRSMIDVDLSQYTDLLSLCIRATHRVEKIVISGKGIAVVRVVAAPACEVIGPPELVIKREELPIES